MRDFAGERCDGDEGARKGRSDQKKVTTVTTQLVALVTLSKNEKSGQVVDSSGKSLNRHVMVL